MMHCLIPTSLFAATGRAILTLATLAVPVVAVGADSLPEFSKVSEGYEEIAPSDQQDVKGLFKVWKREKDGQVIGELPKNFATKKYFLALTVSSGDKYAGLQSGDWVVQWRKYNDRLALIAPNLTIRATGDDEAKASVKRLFTDQVLLDVPILATGPSGGPVVDLDSLLVGNATKFFGSSVRVTNPRLVALKQAKVFKKNIELAFEIVGASSKLQTIHYSISEVPATSNGYTPRAADERIGYFTTSFTDLGKYDDDETRIRYINRWHLEKRDPKLKLSPPKEPIRFYIEHTAPVRYRRWIKEGIEFWNKAFEEVGLVDAIVVEYQDAATGIHMEKDPEDVSYNFVRWLNNDVGTAIGPSRVHPETGQILDADIILTDGWIRHFRFNYHDLMPQLAMEGMGPDTLAWLAEHPSWDPRVRFASPSKALHLRQQAAMAGSLPASGHPFAAADPMLLGDDEYDGLYGRVSQKNGLCMAASSRGMEMALARMNWALTLLDDKAGDDKKKDDGEGKKEKTDEEKKEEVAKSDKDKDEAKEDESMLDGMPEWFVGPLLADLVAHEVGHTLGLRHNFKASAMLTLDEINSRDVKGKKTITASVMDYTPINYRYESGEIQGDYGMIDLGPYDFWAIEYGYVLDAKKLPGILERCTEPALQFATDEDTSGPDPLARRYDFGRDPLAFANEQTKLVQLYRERILDKFVEDGDGWGKARRAYELTLGLQVRMINMMANWVGGTSIHRDRKGDPGDRDPVEVIPAEQQREALKFVIDQAFNDQAFGLNPELLARMSVDKWLDSSSRSQIATEGAWPIHDRVLGVQSSALTLLMNPTTLRGVYDNELRVAADVDVLTLPELLNTISEATWAELSAKCPEDRDDRRPMISSLRRNLQREHVERLLDLVLATKSQGAASKPISNLARLHLKELQGNIQKSLKSCGDKMDVYSKAHLSELDERIGSALKAGYTYGSGNAGGGIMQIRFGQPTDQSRDQVFPQ